MRDTVQPIFPLSAGNGGRIEEELRWEEHVHVLEAENKDPELEYLTLWDFRAHFRQ